jgi:hypothetical protein
MSLFRPAERVVARAFSGLVSGNPFLPERIEYERTVLGSAFIKTDQVWHPSADRPDNPNLPALYQHAQHLVDDLYRRLVAEPSPQALGEDLSLYEDLVWYLLFYRYFDDFFRPLTSRPDAAGRFDFYDAFARDLEHYLAGAAFESRRDPAHLFACFFQARRGFHFIHRDILGGSLPIARLRATVWQSIVTHDVKRYYRGLYRHMGEVTTLVTGPSGTGKELVARAIALGRYIPFDVSARKFAEDYASSFHPLNLSALASTLIESELFGHRRGAFTGALQDRTGWFELCSPLGAVFLDEIGDVDLSIQVKLLRVIQTRTFQRIGDTRPREFRGKIIAATNRDLLQEIQRGRFREDLYYRLCADLVTTPSLREQLEGSPEELRTLIRLLAERIAGVESADAPAGDVNHWIQGHLGPDYPWSGNVRELEQCVRNVMIRGEYHPSRPTPIAPREHLADEFLDGSLTAEELLGRYCTMVYAQTGSYQETARRLGLDRRTVRTKVNPELLKTLGSPLDRAETSEG